MTTKNTITLTTGSAENLVKTTMYGAIELSEAEVRQVSGGRVGGDRQKYLQYKLSDVIVTSIQVGSETLQ